MRAWENADFGPPARNRKKIAEKSKLASPGKYGKNRPKIGKMAQKSVFGPFVLFWGDFFPILRVRPKSIFRRFFFRFWAGGPKSVFSQAHIHTQLARRDRLMSRGKNCRETIFASHLSRNYPHRGVKTLENPNLLK